MLKVAKLWCYWEVEPNGGGDKPLREILGS